jgi:hypothetical protein
VLELCVFAIAYNRTYLMLNDNPIEMSKMVALAFNINLMIRLALERILLDPERA